MKKTHDLLVKVGTYMKGKEVRNDWINVGFVMESKFPDGEPIIFISKTFNPAGVEGHEGKKNIPINMFPVREKDLPDGEVTPF